jgi:hypothetical protein
VIFFYKEFLEFEISLKTLIKLKQKIKRLFTGLINKPKRTLKNISNCVRSADTIDIDKKGIFFLVFLHNKDYPNLSTLLRDIS